MPDTFYRTGQAAAILGVSSHILRRLSEAGLIEADYTGRQWRIPAGEVERLKREGIPPLPSASNPNPPDRQNGAGAKHELLAPPSQEAAASAEDALISENKLKATASKVARLELKKKATEIGDFFRGRRHQEADQEAARRRQEQEDQEERDREARRQRATEQRREWRDEWIRYAQRSRPYDVPETLELDIVEQVEQVLQKLDPSRDYYVTRDLVDAVVKRALEPWERRKEKAEALERVLFRWSIDVRSDPAWEIRGRKVAAGAIDRLRDDASRAEMETAVDDALRPLMREYQHAQKCELIVSGVSSKLRNETSEECQDAQDAVRQALAELPPEASDRQIELACETALQPIRERIADRQDSEMRDEVMNSLRSWAMWLSAPGISEKLKSAAAAELREAIDALPQGTTRTQLAQLRDRTVQRYKKAHELRQQKEDLIDTGLRERVFRTFGGGSRRALTTLGSKGQYTSAQKQKPATSVHLPF